MKCIKLFKVEKKDLIIYIPIICNTSSDPIANVPSRMQKILQIGAEWQIWILCSFSLSLLINNYYFISFSVAHGVPQSAQWNILTHFSPGASTGGRREYKPHLHVNLKTHQVLSIV